MVVPKLPLVVPKKAISTTAALVPKISPKIAPVLFPKGPPSLKSLSSGSSIPPTKLVNDNSVQKIPENPSKSVSSSDLGVDTLNSFEESLREPDFINADLNFIEALVRPDKPFTQNSNNFKGKKGSSDGRSASSSSYDVDIVNYLKNYGVRNDFGGENLTKSFSSSVSLEKLNTDELLKLKSLDHEAFGGDSNATNESNEADKKKNDKCETNEREDVGYTPWLKIERRINEIRSMISEDFIPKPVDKKPKGLNVYSNYNPEYEEGKWKKELTHPLTFGMIKRLNDKRQVELPKDNWKFINGFLKPRRKPFTSMSEMSKHFQNVNSKDQYELIKLLLACRDLEKMIEEQHTVLDMLDHDLREAKQLFPDSLNNINTQKLHGSAPEEMVFPPSTEAPVFIKGRVLLLPDNAKYNNGN